MAWEPLPIRKPGFELTSRKEGKTLANSVTEDVGGFSLMPSYSVEQLQEISRRHRKFGKDSHTKSARKGWRFVSSW